MNQNNSKFKIQNSKLLNIPCVILAGGKSSRMGEDKSLLPFNGYSSLIQFQYTRLSEYFETIYISSKRDKVAFLKESGEYEGANFIFDDMDIFSPLAALKTILKTLNNNEIFIITVDTPFISIDTIQIIIENSKNHEISVAQTDKTHNLCGVFSKSLLPTIENMLNKDIHKINYLLKSSDTNYTTFNNKDEFLNLNTPEDYKKALTFIS